MTERKRSNSRLVELEVQKLRVVAESKLKEAQALEAQARLQRDEELEIAARARRADAREYLSEVKRRTGSDEFLRGLGLGGQA